MKSIFFTGKGGVGKSTLSASAAWQLSKKNFMVLLVSFDPAHNLGDIFNRQLGHKKLQYTKNLYLQETDLDQAAQDYLNSNLNLLTEVYSYMRAFNLEKYFHMFKYSPGVEEYAALTCLEKIFSQEKDFDFIVFDTPPTGLTLRILALPKITCAWLERLGNLRREILNKRYTIHNITGKYDPEGKKLVYKESKDKVLLKILDMQSRYEKVRKWMQGKNNMFALVFNPDFLSLRESKRLLNGLNELELKPLVAFNNKIDPSNIQIHQNMEQQLLDPKLGIKLKRIPKKETKVENNYLVSEDVSEVFISG
jgi:arsenite-transporting ATPase